MYLTLHFISHVQSSFVLDNMFRDLDDHDESVRIAVKALGDMRNRSFSDSTLPMASSSPPDISHTTTPPPGLVSRMSQLPLVESALWAYEQGKASSRVVKVRILVENSSIHPHM